jgi:trimeric autotransporter adhesin
MKKIYPKKIKYSLNYLVFYILFFVAPFHIKAQTLTSPQVNFSQRTSTATPSKTIYNIKGDFTMLGNTNLTLVNYSNTTNNEGNSMQYVDIDGDSNTWNSSMATLELSNGGENSAVQNCSTVIFAGLYWTGKSNDADTFNVTKESSLEASKNATHNPTTNITNTNYKLIITRGGTDSDYYPIYTFTNSLGNTYAFHFTNNNGANRVKISVNGGSLSNVSVTYNSGTATFDTPSATAQDDTILKINSLTRNTSKTLTEAQYQDPANSIANVQVFTTNTKNYDKKAISLKGPGATSYTTVTAKTNGANSDIRFPGTSQSGIFIGYQEITDYVKAHGPGAYTVADIALTEGTNSSPGYSGGWVMVVTYENPLMKSRAVTLFDGYAYVNGQLAGGGEYGNIPISGFTTVGSGQVNMKLGVMAAEGDVATNSGSDYLAVQKLNADPTVYNATNYLTLNHAGNTTSNFFNSSIYPIPTVGTSNPILQNNTGVDFSMFTIPNTENTVIGNNQTSTTFRFGSTYEVYTIFGFAMSVDAYIPEPNGLISVNSINNVTNPPILNALPGQTINYSLDITNEGTEATNNTVITIPIPATAIFTTGGTISYNTYNGFTTSNVPYFDLATNKIIWNLGTLPITANHPEYIYADLSFDLKVTEDCAILLSAGCSPEVSLETGTITGTGAVSGSPFTRYFFQGYDDTSCHLPIDGSIKVAIDASSCLSSLAGPDQIASCGGEYITLNASTGANGTWSIISGPSGGGEIFSDNTSPSTTFFSTNVGVYTLRWTTSCNTTDDVLVTLELCNVVNFDGIDDNINFKNKFSLDSGHFSIEAWIKSNATNGNTQTILSKHLSPSAADGYDLRIVNNLISFNWNNTSITSTHTIDTNRWYHIAVTFDDTNYKLYIDGILDKTTSGTNPTSNSVDFIIGAMSQNTDTPYNYYNGWIDELRIWNSELTVNQIRQMMNQEIINDGNNVKGVIIPKNISTLNWTNLAGYYQMNQASDVSNGYLVDKSGNSINGKLKGIYLPEPDTAPLPYTSRIDGNWETDDTWTHYDVWNAPNSFGVDNTTKIDWNIVKTAHNITSIGNKTVLGLLVNSNTLSATNNSKIEVSSYLKLDGKIDLVGKSQLVQTTDSDLDVSSSGYIERDQQGQSNKYNYNYWSSPVSPINNTTNNSDYTVAGIMKDGTTNIPTSITWIGGYDGSPTTPIRLARYWLYKFDNYTNAYANWVKLTENSTIRVGQGFTLKGSGAATATQNYTFTGKPNNGTISSNSVSTNQLLLTGNPYPSALDANAFINDNLGSINGTLYFWEHYTTNNTHVLRDYQGGYAQRNLTGGVPATSAGVDFISGLGSTSHGIPNQYIPIGQAFFVAGNNTTGGTVTYNNSQRGFHKEDEESVSNIMYKIKTDAKTTGKYVENWSNNSNDILKKDTYARIRLGYNSYNNYHRQVLIGFMNDKATSGIDNGYDGLNFDKFPNDMYFLNGEKQVIIQGEGHFKSETVYPIGVKASAEGKVKFMIDDLENFNANQAIYIYDDLTKTYHNIRTEAYEVIIPAGVNHTRFSLCFIDKTLIPEDFSNGNNDKVNPIKVMHIQNGNSLMIHNHSSDLEITQVALLNMAGVSVTSWKIEDSKQKIIKLPIKKTNDGVYIVKIQTTNGDHFKKILIR